MKDRRDQKGFTLIELIMVIVLLAIIAAVAIPKYLDLTTTSRDNAAKATIGGIRSAIAVSYSGTALSGTAAYPSNVTGGMFVASIVPDEPYTPTNDVKVVTANAPITAFDNNGGYVYNSTTGEVRIDVTGKNTL